jgi:prolyl 4-hydroxylase
MKRIEIKNTKSPHFISAWKLDNLSICDEIIDFFEKNPELQNVGRRVSGKIDTEKKDTIDISIHPKNLVEEKFSIMKEYMKELKILYEDYVDQWPFITKFLNSVDIGSFNIQKYNTGGHISSVHSERTSVATLQRIFVFLTYLNDVEEGGATKFDHYDLEIIPEKGKTIIWPAEWTHAHSGSIVTKGNKYVITGWMNFPINNK